MDQFTFAFGIGVPEASRTTTTNGLEPVLFCRTICPLPERMETVAWPNAVPAKSSAPMRVQANFFDDESMSSLHEIFIRYRAGAGTCDYRGNRRGTSIVAPTVAPVKYNCKTKKGGAELPPRVIG